LAHISHKLTNPFEGALAGGGDPATSPLYVFGPFLKLIVVAGVAEVTFGASVWLVVLTIAVVSAMYRMVMAWVTDGSGGSGLSEEEFGAWAVKVNAAITFVEYTLTFLVSMAALVTFIADRFPVLNLTILGFQYRTLVAILLSIMTGWLVNRGPKVAARTFGPATAGVLLLLWAMVITTIWKLGFHLPTIDLRAFAPSYLNYTLGGYARILAVMTGIEVFANLVAAYEGTPQEKGSKAFGSLLIIMGTASVTMLVVGPAIFRLSDPTNIHVSVFTQTMDKLLPAPLAYLGTLVGVAVLLSASAASAQGLQNLALGLKDRHYVPDFIGQRNIFGVADKPVWIEVGVSCLCFLVFGTSEETYLSIYAAGVFVLLSMTGWAATKRLIRERQAQFSMRGLAAIGGTIIASLLTTGATFIIFEERFSGGVWTYFLFIPVLYIIFSYFRSKLGDPSPVKERLGVLEEAMWGGFGLEQTEPMKAGAVPIAAGIRAGELGWQLAGAPGNRRREDVQLVEPRHVLVPLDGSAFAGQALPLAEVICRTYKARLTLMSAVRVQGLLRNLPLVRAQMGLAKAGHLGERAYLRRVARQLRTTGIEVDYIISTSPVTDSINALVRKEGVDLIIASTHGRSGVHRWLIGSVADRIIHLVTKPVLLTRPTAKGNGKEPTFRRLLVPLDGSKLAERVLPYVRGLAVAFDSEVLLLSVPDVPEAHKYGAALDVLEVLREKEETELRRHLEGVATSLREEGLNVRSLVTGSGPARTIVAISEAEAADLIVMATHGWGGLDRLLLGSVAERVLHHTLCPVFLVPVHDNSISQEGDSLCTLHIDKSAIP